MSRSGYLLDTHILLWDLTDDDRISSVHDQILLGDAERYVSIATLWEIAIKSATGKLVMPERLMEIIESSDVQLLPITPPHALHTASLPHHHRDPFDRLLIAQAQIEGLTILTADPQFSRYDVALA